MLRRLFGGSGFHSARSVALRARSHASLQPHFYCPANLRFAYSGSKNVIYLERYAKSNLNWLTKLKRNGIIYNMDWKKYIEDNIDSLKIIGDSSNKVYELHYLNRNYILKKCNQLDKNLSIFWQYMKIVFGHNFNDQITNLEKLYEKLTNEFIPIAKPVYIDSLLKYHVYEKIIGKDYSPDIFLDNNNIHLQLGKYIGYLHELEYSDYGTVYFQNKIPFEDNIYNFSMKIMKKYFTDRNDIKYYFGIVFHNNISFNNYALIMPDISANQVVFSNDMDKINGVVDLDAYIIGPKELELSIIELCIPNNECAKYFKMRYELFNKLPLLKNYRSIFRFVSYLCDLENIEGIEEFMNKNIYYE